MSDKIKVCCPKCGSDDVAKDGALRWDVKSQQWVISGEFDDITCQSCGYESDSFTASPVIESVDHSKQHKTLADAIALLDGVLESEDNFISSEAAEEVMAAIAILNNLNSPPSPDRRELAAALRNGASADIWYDADDYGDTAQAELIEDTQAAMERAATILESGLK